MLKWSNQENNNSFTNSINIASIGIHVFNMIVKNKLDNTQFQSKIFQNGYWQTVDQIIRCYRLESEK